MSALLRATPITVSVWNSRKVIGTTPFDAVETLITAIVGTTRPIEVLVPKPSGRKHTTERITFRQCVINVPRNMQCSERWVFESLRRHNLVMPDIGFTPETVIKALPKIIDIGPQEGVSPEQRNCFLLRDGTALTVWTPKHYPSLAVLRESWREALEECGDKDRVFLAA